MGPIRITGLVIFVIGILCISGYWYPSDWRGHDFVQQFYANFSTELISVAITILIVDRIYESRERIEKKKRMIWDLGSSDIAFSSRALNEIRENMYHTDGSLNNKNLEKANLTGLDFSNSKISNANFKGAVLSGCSFENAELDNCNFRDTVLNNCNFSGCKVNKSVFTNASMIQIECIKSNLKNCDFLAADLSNANLSYAILDGSQLQDVKLIWAEIHHTSFMNTDMQRVDLEKARIKFANFERANLSNAINCSEISCFENVKTTGIIGEPFNDQIS